MGIYVYQQVQWDMGQCGTYRTGKDRKRDLFVLDSSPVGTQK